MRSVSTELRFLVRRGVLSSLLIGGLLIALPPLAAQSCAQDKSSASDVVQTPLPLKTERAFPKLKFAGWEPESETGQVQPIRPILLTHAGDGSQRVFVGAQRGVVHVFPNSQDAESTKVFLDIRDRVIYKDNENEEGFLGLAFHPKYKENGQFFVYYTTRHAPHTSIISRFQVSADDPDRADPNSEQEILRIPQPFWNHNGGTLVFGPDGFLYIGLGDGGAANDPHGYGQKLDTLLGKILRIDIDRESDGREYAIPSDNPFVGRPPARPEIWAYGVRNIWRMSFDRETGVCWAADVGQDLWEEINIVVRGGNYGWNIREGLHPFRNQAPRRSDLIDPIWEYHHDVGKSITGGHVYRGKRLPELAGAYLYADYVSAKHWALRFDPDTRRVVANQEIEGNSRPVFSFGEAEDGEVYFLTESITGESIFRYTRK